MRNRIEVGKDARTGQAVSISRDDLDSKMIGCRGGTGSGKSLLLSGLTMQFIEPYCVSGQEATDPVFVINFSEDLYYLNAIWDKMKQFGREAEFKYLTLDPTEETFHFNALQGFASLPGSLSRKANFLSGGLNIIHGEGFGTGYYSKQNLATIREAIERVELKELTEPTVDDIASELKAMAKAQRGRDASEALYALDALRDSDCLLPHADPKKNIDVAQALETCQVTYAFLPTLQEGLLARAVGTLMLWTIVNQSAYRIKQGLPKRRVFVVLEEAAQVCHGQSFADVLTLARKLGIILLCSYQSESQLRGSGRNTDMSINMRDNTSIRFLLKTNTEPGGHELKDLQSYSKDVTKIRRGTSNRGLTESASSHEVIEPELERNDVLDVNREFGGFFYVKDDAEPQHLRLTFPTSLATHRQLSVRPIPQRTTPPRTTPRREDRITVARRRDSNRPARMHLLRTVFADIQLEEQWKQDTP